MYVCICKGITDAQLLELANKHAANSAAKSNTTLEHAREMLGVGTGCGCCLDFAVGLLDSQRQVEVNNAA